MDDFKLLSRKTEILQVPSYVFMKCLPMSLPLSGLENLFLPFPVWPLISTSLKDPDYWSPQISRLPYISIQNLTDTSNTSLQEATIHRPH